jgi:hypothetical protein
LPNPRAWELTRDYLKEIRLDSRGRIFKINSVLNCGELPQPFLCDNPMDQMWGPDGNFYLITYGDGFFRPNPDAKLVKFSYARGAPGSHGRGLGGPDLGPGAVDRELLERGLERSGPGRLVHGRRDRGGGATAR